jgi:hypothetical protein
MDEHETQLHTKQEVEEIVFSGQQPGKEAEQHQVDAEATMNDAGELNI